MKKEQRSLAARQVTLMVLGYGIGGGILTLPSLAAKIFGSAGWLAVLVVGFFYIGGGWIAAKLAERFPEETILEYSPRLLGKFFGLLFNLIFLVGLFLVIPIETRILQELVNISLLPDAPTWFVSGTFLFTLAYGASREVNQIAQVNEILIEIAIFIGLLVVAGALQNFQPLHLLPVFAPNQIHLAKWQDLLGFAFTFGSYPVVSMVVPYIRNPRETTKATTKAILVLTLIYAFFTVVTFGVFGYKETIKLSWAGLELAKSVNFRAVVLERLDLVLIVSWISALFTTGLISYFIICSGLSIMLGIRPNYTAWALAPLVYYLSASLKNYFIWTQRSLYIAMISVVVAFFFYPLLYLLSFRKVKRHGKNG